NHPALDGPGAVESVQGRQVGQARGLGAPQDVRHAAAFKLEDAGSQAFSEQLVSLRIVKRPRVQVRLRAPRRCDTLQAIVTHRRGCQAQEVHLQEADFLQ